MRGEESSDSESGRMEESSIRRSLETLCQELNMDEHTATEAMDNFSAIWNTYTLEVRHVPLTLFNVLNFHRVVNSNTNTDTGLKVRSS